MRTTLDIADDVLTAVKDLARRENRTVGEVISDLARRALIGAGPHDCLRDADGAYGFHPFPAGDKVVTNEIIDDLRRRQGA